MKKSKTFISVSLIAGMIVFIAWMTGLFSNTLEPGTVERKYEPPSGIAGEYKVHSKAIPEVYEAIGTVSSQKKIVISSQSRGVVSAVNYKEGNSVNQNDLLVKINDEEFTVKLEQARQSVEIAESYRQQAIQMSIAAQANFTRTQYQHSSAQSSLSQAEQQWQAAQANLKKTEAQYERIKSFRSQGAATQKDFEEAESQYVQAKASLEQARLGVESAKAQLSGSGEVLKSALAGVEQARLGIEGAVARLAQGQQFVKEAQIALGYTKIYAPDSAVVAEKHIEPGDLAWPGKTLLVLHKPQELQLEAKIPESLRARIVLNQKYAISIDSIGYKGEGEAIEAIPSADPVSRTFLIKLKIPYNEGMYPGMFGKMFVELAATERILIPAGCILRVGQFTSVYVKSSSEKWSRRFVTLGKTHGNQIEVLSGLNPEETIALLREQ